MSLEFILSGGILLKEIRKNKKVHLCSLIYHKYSTNASIPRLYMPSSGKILHAFASVRDCQREVSTRALFLWEDMWIYAHVSPLQYALSLLACISRGPDSHLRLSAWWNICEISCSGFSAPSEFSAIKTRVLPPLTELVSTETANPKPNKMSQT